MNWSPWKTRQRRGADTYGVFGWDESSKNHFLHLPEFNSNVDMEDVTNKHQVGFSYIEQLMDMVSSKNPRKNFKK